MDSHDAITQSCDVYFYDLAYRVGIDRMAEFMAKFGFGVKTGVDSTGERSGLLPSREWKRGHDGMPWFPGETLITGIGQGALLVTPLQLANSTAAFSLRGLRYRPHLVKAIEKIPQYTLSEIPNQIVGHYELLREKNWQHVHDAMISVVHGARGTAHGISRGMEYVIGTADSALADAALIREQLNQFSFAHFQEIHAAKMPNAWDGVAPASSMTAPSAPQEALANDQDIYT